jgi:lysophospholipase L1-like esterase
VAQWVRYAGRIMCAGDSITEGYNDLVGGWRPGLSTALAAAGVGYVYVGPYSDAYGAHRGVAGDRAGAQGAGFQADMETYDPRVVILAYGVNDIGGEYLDATGTLAALSNVVALTKAGAPQATILMQSLIVPGPGFPTYYANRAQNVAVNAALPAWCNARGVRFVDIGSPATSDGVHPTAGGYASQAATIAAAVLAALPG